MTKQEQNEKYWFKRKRFGYGWIPATRVGWAVMIAYAVFASMLGVLLLKDVPDGKYEAKVGVFFSLFAVLTLIMIYVTRAKGPIAKWRWGKKDTDNPDEDF